MPDDLNVSSDYGPGKFQKLFDRGLDFALDRLLRRADEQGGNLSTVDIREELLGFKAEPGTDMVDYFDEAWRECTFAVEKNYETGGAIEIIHRESDKVLELRKLLEESREAEQVARLKCAKMEVQAQKDRNALEDFERKNMDDHKIFTRQIQQLKESLSHFDEVRPPH